MISSALFSAIQNQSLLPLTSIHGISHWKRVETIGILLATRTGADTTVITHFAYIHDSRRLNEDFDPEHGVKASLFCLKLAEKGLIQLSTKQLEQLCCACEKHSDHRFQTKDSTIATCLDADRLDLMRLGIVPYKKWLLTQEARRFVSSGFICTSG